MTINHRRRRQFQSITVDIACCNCQWRHPDKTPEGFSRTRAVYRRYILPPHVLRSTTKDDLHRPRAYPVASYFARLSHLQARSNRMSSGDRISGSDGRGNKKKGRQPTADKPLYIIQYTVVYRAIYNIYVPCVRR